MPTQKDVLNKKIEKGEHWFWKGEVDKRKNPIFNQMGDRLQARRVVWVQQGNTLEHEEILFNKCGEKSCVLPAHQKVTLRTGQRHDTCSKGHSLLDSGNVYVAPDGRVRCQKCKRERTYESQARTIQQKNWIIKQLTEELEQLKNR